ARLARAYPGFAEYISEFVLVDRKGNAFYPTAETRTFLLERALRGDVPRVIIAEAPAVEAPQRALPKVRVKSASVAAVAPGRRTVTTSKPAIEPAIEPATKPAAEAT